MFGRKKKKALFGQNIEQRCAYCRYCEIGQDGAELCLLKLEQDSGKCRKYEYDPLRREPRKAPALRKGYSADDFKL